MKDPQDSAGHNVLAPSANQVATGARYSPLTRDSPSNRQSLAHDKALAPAELARDKTHNKALSRDQALVTSALAHGLSESDSDDDAVVFGRSGRSKTKNQKNKSHKHVIFAFCLFIQRTVCDDNVRVFHN